MLSYRRIACERLLFPFHWFALNEVKVDEFVVGAAEEVYTATRCLTMAHYTAVATVATLHDAPIEFS